MLLLLQISRTREGSAAILDAGLFTALRDSLIFRADPDLGLDIESQPSALPKYYTLLSSSLRVLLSTFLSRGAQNEQAQYLIRTFLSDYRANMVGVFKKASGVSGKVDERSKVLLEECVRCYTGLVIGCGFVDVSLPCS